MGNGMNKIIPGLYIGNFRDAKDMEQIKDNEITHIVAIHDNPQPVLKEINYLCIDISDTPGQNISEHFVESINFIHKCRKKGGRVLVHCIAGVSRSCTICAAYLMVIAKVSFYDAILCVRSARSVVNPNYGFQKQLQTFESVDLKMVRNKLVEKYGELDPADIEYVKMSLLNNEYIPNCDETNLILGTTPTFANYERKKVKKNDDK